MKIKKVISLQAIGLKPNQEDSIYPLIGEETPQDTVFLICDGMGGHENGEVASSIVAQTVGNLTKAAGTTTVSVQKDTFSMALAQAYEVLNQVDDSCAERKMGTTLTFLAFCQDGALVAHIGDSRVYQLRKGSGVIFQTRDHSLVNDLIASGDLTPEQACTYPHRNIITRAVQPHQENPSKPSFKVLTDVQKGDIFMLCSDGIVEKLENEELERILFSDSTLEKCGNRLLKVCAERQTRDNHSCIIIEMEKGLGSGQLDEKKDNILTRIIKKWL